MNREEIGKLSISLEDFVRAGKVAILWPPRNGRINYARVKLYAEVPCVRELEVAAGIGGSWECPADLDRVYKALDGELTRR